MLQVGNQAQNATSKQLPGPVRVKPCVGVFTFSFVGNDQGNDKGSLGLGREPGTAAINPHDFGWNYPEQKQKGESDWHFRHRRVKMQNSKITPNIEKIHIEPHGLKVPKGMPDDSLPTPPYTATDIGDSNIRGAANRIDIYTDVSKEEANKLGKQKAKTTVYVPASWPCPRHTK